MLKEKINNFENVDNIEIFLKENEYSYKMFYSENGYKIIEIHEMYIIVETSYGFQIVELYR